MSDILDPQGLEPNETLQDTDIQGVYQPTSGGIRRNKQSTLATLKAFFNKFTTFTANNIVEADGTGNLRTTSIATSAVSQSITDTNNNSNELTDKINQGVKTTDTPTFADATIASHAIDAELSTLNSRVNQGVKTTDSPTFAKVNTGQGANELYPMNQGVQTTDTPEFADVNITGLTGTVEDRIETNTADIATLDGRVDGNDSDIATLDGRVDGNDSDITTLDGRVDGNDTDIDALQTKTPQSYKTTDSVEFSGGVKTDGVTLRTKVVEIGDWDMDAIPSLAVDHGINPSKIRSVFVAIRDDNDTTAQIYDLNTLSGGSISSGIVSLGILGTNTLISLRRETGSIFDNPAFNLTSYNRGWITIIYEV